MSVQSHSAPDWRSLYSPRSLSVCGVWGPQGHVALSGGSTGECHEATPASQPLSSAGLYPHIFQACSGSTRSGQSSLFPDLTDRPLPHISPVSLCKCPSPCWAPAPRDLWGWAVLPRESEMQLPGEGAQIAHLSCLASLFSFPVINNQLITMVSQGRCLLLLLVE